MVLRPVGMSVQLRKVAKLLMKPVALQSTIPEVMAAQLGVLMDHVQRRVLRL